MKKEELSKKTEKLEILYRFCQEVGFHHSIEDISAGIGISKKTFFNRYQNRENMITIIREHWRSKFKERFETKSKLCNHPIEIILLFIYEIQYSHKKEYFFFQEELETEDYLLKRNEKSLFFIIYNLINEGIERGYFQEDLEKELFCCFFLFNIFHLYIKEYNIDLIYYLLAPLLSEWGKELLEDIDLLRMFSPTLHSFNSSL